MVAPGQGVLCCLCQRCRHRPERTPRWVCLSLLSCPCSTMKIQNKHLFSGSRSCGSQIVNELHGHSYSTFIFRFFPKCGHLPMTAYGDLNGKKKGVSLAGINTLFRFFYTVKTSVETTENGSVLFLFCGSSFVLFGGEFPPKP